MSNNVLIWRGLRMAALTILAGSSVLGFAPEAMASDPTPPSTRLLDTLPISPTTAATFYGSGTTHSVGLPTVAVQEPELDALASSLLAGRDINIVAQKNDFIQTVFDYVRNNIDTEFRYGLGKGGRGAFIDQSGTPFDQAELMVKLLRKGGVTASYGVGEITISGTQFGLWTGLVKDLDQPSQTVTVGAIQACKLMASGAIPEVVNNQSGLTSCDSLSNDLTTMTLSHVWVKVGGAIYDPSLKTYYLKQGIDIPAAMGCGTKASSTCGSSVKSATTGSATLGADNGVPYIVGYSSTAGGSQIYSLSQNLVNFIKTSNRIASVEDTLGGRELRPQTSSSMLASYLERLTWSGDIPDQYRTLYITDSSINNSYPINYAFYADEIAGRKVANAPTMFIDDLQLNPGPSADYSPANLRRSFPSLPCTTNCVTITVDHPYSSDSGLYADEQQTFKMVEDPTYEAAFFRPFNSVTGIITYGDPDSPDKDFPEKSNFGSYPIVFIHGFGQAGLDSLKYETEKANVASFSTQTCVTGSTTGVVQNRCGNASQNIAAASVNPYRTLMDKLVDGVATTVSTRHHDVGIVYASKTPEISRLTLQESLSVTARSGSEVDRRSGYNMQAITLSEVEGMVSPLEDGAQFSFASMFFKKNALPLRDTNAIFNDKVYLVSPANMATFLAAQPDANPTPSFHGAYPNGWTCGSTCWRKTQLQSIADQGYSTIIMAGGQSEIFFNGTTSAQDRKAYTIWEYMKGGAAVSDPFQAAMKTTEVIDAASNARKQMSVSPATGDLTYQAEPDIVSGSGDFPMSLPFIRTFHTTYKDRIQSQIVYTEPRNCTQSCGLVTNYSHKTLPSGADGAFHDRLGGGWDHNYNISLTLTNNPSKNLGGDYVLDAAPNIARLQVIHDLSGATDANTDLATQVTLVAATVYMGWSMDAIVKIGSESDTLHFGSSGYYSMQNPNAKLVVTASNPNPVSYTYTSAKGDSILFTQGAGMVEINPNTGAYTLKDVSRTWLPNTWTFPNGVILTFNYALSAYPTGDESIACQFSWGWSCVPWRSPAGSRLVSVSNNLGRSLTFSTNSASNPNNYINTTVTDENGRQAIFAVSGCAFMPTEGSGTYWFKFTTTCGQFTATDPNGLVTKYEYTPTSSLLGVRNNYRLTKIYSPSNMTIAFQTIDYDGMGRVTKVTDRQNHSALYYPGGINGGERWKPTNMIAPGGERTFIAYNSKGSDVLTRSPMGRETRKSFDNANRLSKTVLPEGNGSENTYDARGNLVKVRTFSKDCGNLALACSDDMVVQTDYVGDEASMTCTNSVICNKPSSSTDALGNTTNYEWDAATGDLTRVQAPADKTGVRPETTATYTFLNGVSFLTSKTETVSSSKTVTTAYTYNSAKHYTLQTMTLDPTGLNLQTTLDYDMFGNLVSVNGPVPGAADTTTYKWDAGRRLEWVVSPDPDDGGSLLSHMTKYTYNADDQVIRTDTGTATGADGANFSPTKAEISTYDAMGNKTETRVVKP